MNDLTKLLELMHRYKARKLVTGEYQIELAAEAFQRPIPPEEIPSATICACGHSLEIEHTETGCLMGCQIELCEKTRSV